MGPRAQAQQLWRTGLVALRVWDLPRPGLEPVSPALAGGFLTTGPPGKPLKYFFETLLVACVPYRKKYIIKISKIEYTCTYNVQSIITHNT